MNEKDLLQVSEYTPSKVKCYAFNNGSDIAHDGKKLSLGNMVRGYEFYMDGVHFYNSECAYICGLFSLNTPEHNEIQQQLIYLNDGYKAKKTIRKQNEHLKRPDWEEFNVDYMLYCVWAKCCSNPEFANLLCSFGADSVIIENSTFQNGKTAAFWGCKNKEQRKALATEKKELTKKGFSKAAIKRELNKLRLGEYQNIGTYIGVNCCGKILMLCRDAILNHSVPHINLELLREKQIYLNGKMLTFEELPQVIIPQQNEKETPMPKQQTKKERTKKTEQRNEEFVRYTTIMRTTNIEKIKTIATSKGITQKDLLDVILTDYISRYEMKYGEVRKREFDPSELLV